MSHILQVRHFLLVLILFSVGGAIAQETPKAPESAPV